MSFLNGDRNTIDAESQIYEFPIAAGVTIYRGALVAIDAAGAAHPAGPTAGFLVVGRAETGMSYMDEPIAPTINPGALPGGIVTAAAGSRVRVRRKKSFLYANSPAGADQLTAANWGQPCYAVDDQTLALTNGGGTRPLAGIFRGLGTGGGAWVEIT